MISKFFKEDSTPSFYSIAENIDSIDQKERFKRVERKGGKHGEAEWSFALSVGGG